MMRKEKEETTSPEPDFPSGEWVGFYQQFGMKHRQDLVLTFSQRILAGEGLDGIGPFVVRGHYDPEERTASWIKSYASHTVFYKGYRETKGIWGTWEVVGMRGGFHIWPRSEGEALAEEEAEELELPAAAATTPATVGGPRDD